MTFKFNNDLDAFSEYLSTDKLLERPYLFSLFKSLESNFTNKLLLKLRHILPEDDYIICEKGDWHKGDRTVVLKGSSNYKIVYKPKSPNADLFMHELFNRFQNKLPLKIILPEIIQYKDFFIQKYIPPNNEIENDLNFTVGALFAIGFWFGVLDLHKQNISCADKGIAIYDIDCLFNGYQGITFMDRLNNIGLIRLDTDAIGRSGINALQLNIDKKEITKGFSLTLRELIVSSKKADYEIIDSVCSRKILVPTKTYFNILQERFIFDWTDVVFADKWLELRKSTGISTYFNKRILETEIQDLLEWNIPFFYQKKDILLDFGQNPLIKDLKSHSNLLTRFHSNIKRNHALIIKEFERFITAYLALKNI